MRATQSLPVLLWVLIAPCAVSEEAPPAYRGDTYRVPEARGYPKSNAPPAGTYDQSIRFQDESQRAIVRQNAETQKRLDADRQQKEQLEMQAASERDAKFKEDREKRLAAYEAARVTAFANIAADNVVNQVLNYTVSGADQGTESAFAFREPADPPCKFRIWNAGARINAGIGYDAVYASPIDLDSLDPKSIAFGRVTGPNLLGDLVISTVVRHEGHIILSTTADVDIDRLHRGWELVFKSHCKGTEKPF